MALIALFPLRLWAIDVVPVSCAGFSLQGRTAGALGGGLELTSTVPYVPFLWGGIGAGLEMKDEGTWHIEGGFAVPMIDHRGFVILSPTMGSGSLGPFVGLSLPIVMKKGKTPGALMYISPFVRLHAWKDQPDLVVGVAWKRTLTIPDVVY
jgi:hypothetical protein